MTDAYRKLIQTDTKNDINEAWELASDDHRSALAGKIIGPRNGMIAVLLTRALVSALRESSDRIADAIAGLGASTSEVTIEVEPELDENRDAA